MGVSYLRFRIFPGLIAYILAWIIIPEEHALPPVVVQTQQTGCRVAGVERELKIAFRI